MKKNSTKKYDLFDLLNDDMYLDVVYGLLKKYTTFLEINATGVMSSQITQSLDGFCLDGSYSGFSLTSYDCPIIMMHRVNQVTDLRKGFFSEEQFQFQNQVTELSNYYFGNFRVGSHEDLMNDDEYFQVSTVVDLREPEFYERAVRNARRMCPDGMMIDLRVMNYDECQQLYDNRCVLLRGY